MTKNYAKISTYFKENWKVVFPLCITALCFDGFMCLVPQIEGETINSLYNNNFDLVKKSVLLFILLVVFLQVNRFFKRYLVRVFSNKVTLKMRHISLNNLLKKDITYFANNKAGDILNKNLSDISDTSEAIRKITTEFFDTIVLLIGYLISMFLMDYLITLISLAFIVLSILVARFMKTIVYKANKDYKEYLSYSKEVTLSKLKNELFYRGFGVSSAYYEQYRKVISVLRKKSLKAALFENSLEPVYYSIALLGVFFIAYIGGLKVMSNVYQIGVLSAYLTTYLLVSRKAGRVGKVFNAYQSFKVSWNRCKEYLVTKEELIYQEPVNDKLILKDFSYTYESGFTIPKLNLEAKKGSIIGICGRVHTGKSTILKGLTGLYAYQGEATLGNVDISKLKDNPKNYISYCSTDVALFTDTLRKNITLDHNGDLDKALCSSCLTSDLASLGGLDCILSHTNSNISGGQQKRVQMARALFGAQKLILLDDPFQSVEKTKALEMINNLTSYTQSIIMLVSNSHEIISRCNQIIYLENNKALIGSYNVLINNDNFKKLMEVS